MSSAMNHTKRSHRSERSHYNALRSMPYIAPNDIKDIAPVFNRSTRRAAIKEAKRQARRARHV